jgi:hypothetical protein
MIKDKKRNLWGKELYSHKYLLHKYTFIIYCYHGNMSCDILRLKGSTFIAPLFGRETELQSWLHFLFFVTISLLAYFNKIHSTACSTHALHCVSHYILLWKNIFKSILISMSSHVTFWDWRVPHSLHHCLEEKQNYSQIYICILITINISLTWTQY